MPEIKRLKVVVEGDDSSLKTVGDTLDENTKKTKRFDDGLTSALRTITGQLMTRAIDMATDLVKKGVEGFSQLEQSVANVSTIAPKIDTKQVFDALNQMSTRIPQTAAQLGDSLYDIFSSMDVTQAEALRMTEQYAKGAVAAATDAKTFGTAVTGVLNAYKLSAKDATRISDLFFLTVKNGVVSGQELASSLGPVTQAAKAAGQSTETLFAAIAAVTREGGPAAQNINNLSNLFQKMTTEKAVEEFHKLGIEVAQHGKYRDLNAILKDTQKALAGMSEEARNNAIQAIFPDAQARQGMQTLLSQLDMVKTGLASAAQASGLTEEAYKKMSGTFESQSKLLQNGIQAITTSIMSQLLPVLTPMVATFSQGLPSALAQVGPVLRQVGQWFATAFSPIMPMVRDVSAFFVQEFGVVVSWFRQNMPLIQTAVQTVLAVIASLWERYGADIKSIVGNALSAVLATVKLAMLLLTGDWRGAGDTILTILINLGTGVRSAFDAVLKTITGIGESIGNAARDIGNAIWQGITGGMDSGKAQVAQSAATLANTAKDSAKTALKSHSPSEVFKDIGKDVVEGFALGILLHSPVAGAAMKVLLEETIADFQEQVSAVIDAYEASIKRLQRERLVMKWGENSAPVLAFDYPMISSEFAHGWEKRIAEETKSKIEFARKKLGESLREMFGNDGAMMTGNPISLAGLAGLLPGQHVANTYAIAGFTLPESGVAGTRQNSGPRMAIPTGAGKAITDAQQAQMLMAPFVAAINASAVASGGRILENLLGGNRRGNVLRTLWDEMANMGRDALGNILGNELRRGLVGMMKEVGGILTGHVNILRASTAQVLSVVSSAYALLAASQRKKQFGIGSILGGIGGFLLGGPAGALAGYNVGNALDNHDYTGAVIGAITGVAAGSFAKGNLGTKSINVTQNNYGGIHQAADLERVNDSLVGRIRGEMLSTG